MTTKIKHDATAHAAVHSRNHARALLDAKRRDRDRSRATGPVVGLTPVRPALRIRGPRRAGRTDEIPVSARAPLGDIDAVLQRRSCDILLSLPQRDPLGFHEHLVVGRAIAHRAADGLLHDVLHLLLEHVETRLLLTVLARLHHGGVGHNFRGDWVLD